jgi:alpha-1,2-mannosyltransferase
VSPVSWTHHWVWIGPALLAWHLHHPASRPARAITLTTWLLFAIAPMWFTPWTGDSGQYGFHYLTTIAANSFLLAGLAYLTWTTWTTWHPRTHPATRSPEVPPQRAEPALAGGLGD